MVSYEALRLLLPRRLREFPLDLAVVFVVVLVADFVTLFPPLAATPVRIVVGLPLVLFLPGYALTAVLFPESGTSSDDPTRNRTAVRRIDCVERAGLSFALSLAVVALLGLALTFTPFGLAFGPVLFVVSGFTILATIVAEDRRRSVPPDDRFSVPYERWISAIRGAFLSPESRFDLALNVLLVAGIVFAASSVVYAVAVPQPSDPFTELYILSETDDGELTAEEYPTEFVVGESRPLVVGISNQEHRQMRYTLVVELQRVSVEGNVTTVRSSRELDRFSPTLAANETWQEHHEITPTMTGERLRLTYLLYRGTAPEDPTTDNADQYVFHWINVTDQ